MRGPVHCSGWLSAVEDSKFPNILNWMAGEFRGRCDVVWRVNHEVPDAVAEFFRIESFRKQMYCDDKSRVRVPIGEVERDIGSNLFAEIFRQRTAKGTHRFHCRTRAGKSVRAITNEFAKNREYLGVD
jgi:hypothetical protein